MSIIPKIASTFISPMGSAGIGGWLLDLETSGSIAKEASVSQNPVEDGSFLSDGYVLKPMVISFDGIVCELAQKNSAFQEIGTSVTRWTGVATRYATMLNKVEFKKIVERMKTIKKKGKISGMNTSTLFSGFLSLVPALDKSQQAFAFLSSLMDNKILLNITTHTGYYLGFVLTKLQSSKKGESVNYSTFSLTFEEYQIGKVRNDVSKDANNIGNSTGFNTQKSKVKNNGIMGGWKRKDTFLTPVRKAVVKGASYFN